jgi:hypothetical protein
MGSPIFTIGYREGRNLHTSPCEKYGKEPHYRAGFALGARSPMRFKDYNGERVPWYVLQSRRDYLKLIWLELFRARRKEREIEQSLELIKDILEVY